MHVHFLQHVPFEGAGSIASWIERRRARATWTRMYRGEKLPPLDKVDLLILLGGPMSVNDAGNLPWLAIEKEYIRDAIAWGGRVLGICLGAQLIASALGARVYRSRTKEIGWYLVEGIPAPGLSFPFPPSFPAFHWHGETYDLPTGALRLARSVDCEQQAFQVGRNVLGLQFHLEVTLESVQSLIENCGEDLKGGTQSATEIRDVEPSKYAFINAIMDRVLDYMVAVVD